MTLKDAVIQAKVDYLRKRMGRDKKHEKDMEEYERIKLDFKRIRRKHLSKASVLDYKEWLEGYIESGNGEITRYCDYPFNGCSGFYLAIRSFTLPPLYGSTAVNIIVPEGVEISYTDLGHNQLYFMKDYKCKSFSVPVYNDTAFLEK